MASGISSGATLPDAARPLPAATEPQDDALFQKGQYRGFGAVIEAGSRAYAHSLGFTDDETTNSTAELYVDKATDPSYLVPGAAAFGGASAVLAARELRNARAPLTAGNLGVHTLGQMGTNSMRITPTLVSAIAGPALADIASYVAPGVVPKYKATTSSSPREAPTGTSSNKGQVQFMRAAVGGAGVAALAGIAFLIKPSLFQKAGFISQKAISGMDAATGAKVGTAMAPDAVFTNKVALGAVGGGAAAYMAQRAGLEDGDTRRNLLVGAGAAALTTVGGVKAMPYITRGSSRAKSFAFMPGKEILWKPNLQWFKEYASKVAPFTAVPAGSAAYTYLDTFNDFGKITDPRSDYRD
jgi:hypothetical protein